MKLWEKYMETTYELLDVLKDTEESRVVLVYDRRGRQNCVLKECALRSRALYETLKASSNPHIPAIYRLTEQEGKLLIVEEFVEGRTLDEMIHASSSQAVDEALAIDILRQLCECLSPLHQKGIIHRDIKPSNLILTKDGKVKLIDFGIARSEKQDTDTDTEFLGTRGYAPPEQYGFGQTDARSDIYALGITMQRALGKEYAGRLQPILRRCTALDPANRYPSVDALLKDIERRQTAYPSRRTAVISVFMALSIGALWYGIAGHTPTKETPSTAQIEETPRPVDPATIDVKPETTDAVSAPVPLAAEEAEKLPASDVKNDSPRPSEAITPAADHAETNAASLQSASLIMTPPQFFYSTPWKGKVQCTLLLDDEPVEGFSLPYLVWETWRRENGEIRFPPEWGLQLRIENRSAQKISHPRIRVESFTGEIWLDAPPVLAGQSVDVRIPLDRWPLRDLRSLMLALFFTDDPNPDEPQAGIATSFGLRQ